MFPTPQTPPCPTGCVRQLRIQNEEVAFGELDLQAHGVGNCPTCQDQPCQVRLGGTHMHRPPPPIPSLLLIRVPPSPERRHLRGRREQHLRLPLSPRLHRQQLRVLAGTALPPRWVPTLRGHHPLPSLPGCCPPPALTAHLCPLPGQRRADLMPPVSTGRMGRATAAAATWASLGRGAPKVSTAGDRARGWEPSGDRGTGVGTTLEMRVWGWDHSGDRGTRVGTTPGRWTWGTQV